MFYRKWFTVCLTIALVMSSLVFIEPTYAEEGPIASYRYTPNEDGSIFIEGVGYNSKNEKVSLRVSTGDFVIVGKKKEYKRVILFETTVPANKNGYFAVTTIPIDAAQVQRNSITISFYDERGKESSISPDYPLPVPKVDTNIYYVDPDHLPEGEYDKYKDDYTPQTKVIIDYSQYGVGSAAPDVHFAKQIKQVVKPISVAASDTHVIALTADGTLYGWGDNLHNELNNSIYPVLPVTKINKVSNVSQVGAGDRFSLYLTKQGELFGWGDLNYLGIQTKTGTPQKVTLVPEAIKKMDVYSNGVVLLTHSGNVYQLGGAPGTGMKLLKNHSRKIGITGVIDVTIGDLNRAYAVKKDGTVWFWDTNMKETETIATPIQGFKNIRQISSSGANNPYLIAIDQKGNLWAWGSNSSRQLGFNVTQKMYKPIMINRGPIRITKTGYYYPQEDLVYKSISAADNGALVITDKNEMLFMGYNAGTIVYADTKEAQRSYQNVTLIETSKSNMYWVSGGKLWVAGYRNELGQLGFGVKLN